MKSTIAAMTMRATSGVENCCRNCEKPRANGWRMISMFRPASLERLGANAPTGGGTRSLATRTHALGHASEDMEPQDLRLRQPRLSQVCAVGREALRILQRGLH